MSGFAEYDDFDALGLGELVNRGDVDPRDLLDEAIARAEAVNPAVNAINAPMYDVARQELNRRRPAGPFAGVPILLKDLLHAYAGFPLTSGSAALRDYVPDHDSVVVSRLRRAGFIPFGKTNVPEFGLVATTEPEAFGPTRNPWNLHLSAGGSSGGSGAAVAAGIVPVASATDGGGSIRIPAAWCGLFGLKPTRGRVPVGPAYDEIWSGAVVHGVLSRSVRDTAAALDVLAGAARGDVYTAPPADRPFLQEVGAPTGKLRIAYSTSSPIGSPVDPECEAAVGEALLLLKDLGHTVVEDTPQVDGLAVARCYFVLSAGHVAADLRSIARIKGGSVAALEVEDTTRLAGLIGESLPSGSFVGARLQWNDFARAMVAFHDSYDLYVTPTTSTGPMEIGTSHPKGLERAGLRMVNFLRAARPVRVSGLFERLALERFAPVPFTALANLTGQPAMSVPLYWGSDGRPVGVHFVARGGDEATLFRLGAQLEEARPWRHRRPHLHGRTSTLPLGRS